MPLPKPQSNENKDDFLDRCMANPTMNDEYPDNDQRYAVCNDIWQNKESKMKVSKVIKYNSQKAEEIEDRTLRFIGSTEHVDRHGEVIKADGWKLTTYKKNPVVLVNHKHSDLPVAKTKNVWVDKEAKSLMFDIEFPDMDVSSEGDTLYKLYKNGYMNATSVGFLPNPEKMVFGEKKGDPSVTYTEQELLEISLVSVPANPNALLTSKSIEKAIEDEVVDETEINELKSLLAKYFEEEEVEEKELEDEEPVEKDDEPVIEKEETPITCKDCGVEIKCLCPDCIKKQENEKIYKELYEMLISLK